LSNLFVNLDKVIGYLSSYPPYLCLAELFNIGTAKNYMNVIFSPSDHGRAYGRRVSDFEK